MLNRHKYGKVLVAVHTDISDKKKAEEALRKRAMELEKFQKASHEKELKIIKMANELNRLKKEKNKRIIKQ